jgi:hypothetical protein
MAQRQARSQARKSADVGEICMANVLRSSSRSVWGRRSQKGGSMDVGRKTDRYGGLPLGHGIVQCLHREPRLFRAGRRLGVGA